MAETPTPLVLDHLRALRGDMAAVREDNREIKHRLHRIETGIAGLRRDQAADAETVAHLEARLDKLGDRLERIERRLDLTD